MGERIRLAMGLPLRPVTEHSVLSDGVEESAIAAKYYDPPLINVIKYACNACAPTHYEVTSACQGCLARHCQHACPKGVTFGRSPKSDQKRCLKPQVSGLPARLGCAENRGRVPRENQDSADRRTTDRVRSSYRCRSCVPCGGALVYRRGQKAVAPEREMLL